MMSKATKTATVTRVLGYIRVSTERQADAGVSLDAQRAKLTAYAALYDLALVGIIEDAGASAKTLRRPGLQQALGMLKAGEADALLVAKLDRLTQDTWKNTRAGLQPGETLITDGKGRYGKLQKGYKLPAGWQEVK